MLLPQDALVYGDILKTQLISLIALCRLRVLFGVQRENLAQRTDLLYLQSTSRCDYRGKAENIIDALNPNLQRMYGRCHPCSSKY